MPAQEYCVFPKSKYQSDGWEPFLPPHPLSDTVFEHLALEFQARKRVLDQVRQKQSGTEHDFFLGSNRAGVSRDKLAIDLSNVRSIEDFASRLLLVDDDFNEYLSSPRYQPSLEQIKRFLYVEARRLSCTFPGWEVSGSSFASIKHESQVGEQSKMETKDLDDDEEEEKYRDCLLRLADLHLLPKIVEAVVYLSGSGAADWITDFRSKTHVKALSLFKSGICNSLSHLGISKSEISIVSIKNVTAGKLAESAEIDFQIFTFRSELCAALADGIRAAVNDGSLASRLNHHGLPVYVSLVSGPLILEYPQEKDLTQRLFGSSAAKLLRLRLLRFGGAIAPGPAQIAPPPPPPAAAAVVELTETGDGTDLEEDGEGSHMPLADNIPPPQRAPPPSLTAAVPAAAASAAAALTEAAASVPARPAVDSAAAAAAAAPVAAAASNSAMRRAEALSVLARAESSVAAVGGGGESGKRRKRFRLGPKDSMVEDAPPQRTAQGSGQAHGFRLHRRAATSLGTYKADEVVVRVDIRRQLVA